MEIKNLTDFIKLLSWQKIIQTFVFIAILIAAWGMWENRVVIYNSVRVSAKVETNEPLYITLSQDSISYIEEIAKKSNSRIAGVQIVSVNFRKNTRITSYFSISEPILKSDYDTFLRNKITDTPLFVENETNNQILINLINGEFICSDFKDTIAVKLFPNAQSKILTICSVSIPPYYGRFSGYMNMYLYKKLSADDVIFIKQLSRDISLRIYENDIDKSKVPYVK